MDKIVKLLRKIRAKDHKAINETLARIFLRSLDGLDVKKLSGFKNLYRVRVGQYRIIYEDDGSDIWIYSVKRRDESTYKDL